MPLGLNLGVVEAALAERNRARPLIRRAKSGGCEQDRRRGTSQLELVSRHDHDPIMYRTSCLSSKSATPYVHNTHTRTSPSRSILVAQLCRAARLVSPFSHLVAIQEPLVATTFHSAVVQFTLSKKDSGKSLPLAQQRRKKPCLRRRSSP